MASIPKSEILPIDLAYIEAIPLGAVYMSNLRKVPDSYSDSEFNIAKLKVIYDAENISVDDLLALYDIPGDSGSITQDNWSERSLELIFKAIMNSDSAKGLQLRKKLEARFGSRLISGQN